MIVPIQQRKEGVLEKAAELKEMLKDIRVKVDDADKSPGWKFSEQEQLSDVCVCCGKPAKKMVYWGRAY